MISKNPLYFPIMFGFILEFTNEHLSSNPIVDPNALFSIPYFPYKSEWEGRSNYIGVPKKHGVYKLYWAIFHRVFMMIIHHNPLEMDDPLKDDNALIIH